MTPMTKPGRGRPKGTGLNDAAHLRAIADLIAADPDLKPTTAIKTLGISDPSVIRRLRDKYHAAEQGVAADPGRAANAETFGQPVPAAYMTDTVPGEARTTGRAVPLAHLAGERKTAPVTPSSASIARPAASAAARDRTERQIPPQSEPALPPWIGAGLSMYAYGVGAQLALASTFFAWLPVVAAVNSHVVLTQLAVAMAAPQHLHSPRIG
jgi:hypothetical protein